MQWRATQNRATQGRVMQGRAMQRRPYHTYGRAVPAGPCIVGTCREDQLFGDKTDVLLARSDAAPLISDTRLMPEPLSNRKDEFSAQQPQQSCVPGRGRPQNTAAPQPPPPPRPWTTKYGEEFPDYFSFSSARGGDGSVLTMIRWRRHATNL